MVKVPNLGLSECEVIQTGEDKIHVVAVFFFVPSGIPIKKAILVEKETGEELYSDAIETALLNLKKGLVVNFVFEGFE